MEEYSKNNYFHPHLPLKDFEGKNEIIIQELKEIIKIIPQQDYPTEKLAKIVYIASRDIKKVKEVKITRQYPIIIMVDENEKVKYILDGNNRTQKALNLKLKTIPAKLIRSSNFNSKLKKIVLSYFELQSYKRIQKYVKRGNNN
tara:strand:- start:17 stop:448 length:432 start_codon:yes stop_codon:yes gene_type:complete